MGMHGYTTVHLLPLDRLWTPSINVLQNLLEYFKPASTSICGYDGPEYWDSEDQTTELYAVRNIPYTQASAEYAGRRAISTMFILDGVPWSGQIENSITAMIPSEIADGYVAWNVHLWVGPLTIPDHWLERTVAETMFCLNISGDGMPADMPRYLELLLKTPEMQELNRFLAGITDQPWQALISANY